MPSSGGREALGTPPTPTPLQGAAGVGLAPRECSEGADPTCTHSPGPSCATAQPGRGAEQLP